jgi:hypothetical protein
LAEYLLSMAEAFKHHKLWLVRLECLYARATGLALRAAPDLGTLRDFAASDGLRLTEP